jgi:hypothetical protein
LRDLGDRQVLLVAVVAGELRGAPAFADAITHRLTPLIDSCRWHTATVPDVLDSH